MLNNCNTFVLRILVGIIFLTPFIEAKGYMGYSEEELMLILEKRLFVNSLEILQESRLCDVNSEPDPVLKDPVSGFYYYESDGKVTEPLYLKHKKLFDSRWKDEVFYYLKIAKKRKGEGIEPYWVTYASYLYQNVYYEQFSQSEKKLIEKMFADYIIKGKLHPLLVESQIKSRNKRLAKKQKEKTTRENIGYPFPRAGSDIKIPKKQDRQQISKSPNTSFSKTIIIVALIIIALVIVIGVKKYLFLSKE